MDAKVSQIPEETEDVHRLKASSSILITIGNTVILQWKTWQIPPNKAQ